MFWYLVNQFMLLVIRPFHVLGNSPCRNNRIRFNNCLPGSKGVLRLMDSGDCGKQILGTVGNVLVGG